MEEASARSIREFARKSGENCSVVSRHLRRLRLPDGVISLLEQDQTPEELRHFTVKRQGALTRVPHDKPSAPFRRQALVATGGAQVRAWVLGWTPS